MILLALIPIDLMFRCWQKNSYVRVLILISQSVALLNAQNIYHKMERRNLAAAYKFYCGRKMEDDFEAHRADQDTEATWRVLQGQLDMYAPENQPKRIVS